MVSADKLIKVGVKYSDKYFETLKNIYNNAYRNNDSLEDFLNETKDYSIGNPLEAGGFKEQLTNLVVASTNDIRFSRPAQKALMNTIISNTTGELITNVGDDIKAGVRDIVSRGYREGKLNHNRVADEINSKLDGINRKRARTIARTEIKRAQTTSNYVVARERGANAYTYKCGAKPCDICIEDCGETFPIDDTEHLPPRHPNCMCGVSFFKDPSLPPADEQDSTSTGATGEDTFDEKRFNKLKTNEEIADFFGFKYNPNGESYDHIGGKTFEFYDPKNDCTLRFFKDETNRMNYVDYTNSGKEFYNLKDLVRMYDKSPIVLKETVGTMVFGVEHHANGMAIAGGYNQHHINIYKNAVETEKMNFDRRKRRGVTDINPIQGIEHTMHHEMAHCFDYNHNLKDGRYQGVVGHEMLKEYYDATQKDYEFQKEHGYKKQDASLYGGSDFTEDFAEMFASVTSYERGRDIELVSQLDKIKVPDENAKRGFYRRDQLASEMIERNPNRYELVKKWLNL
ncbi:phage minor head protein [uncultured Methanobrevibacter sp.]|uniref:phage minor head protein n=1 Tax=uncultured Methanobrevibacter sp. TaxID=253161 RepID=UPI0025DDA462|nr:phage minor head protein [uncultured Methanobrevibacter sp.]